MSGPREDGGRGDTAAPERVQAGVRHGWWPGWIWAIPIAALLVVIWLGARALLAGGTDVTIRFNDAHGMKKENTDVVLRGTQVGHVTDIALTPDGTGVIVNRIDRRGCGEVPDERDALLAARRHSLLRRTGIAQLAPFGPDHRHGSRDRARNPPFPSDSSASPSTPPPAAPDPLRGLSRQRGGLARRRRSGDPARLHGRRGAGCRLRL